MSDKARKQKPGRKPGSRVTHGAYSPIARGEFPSKRRYIERWLSEVRTDLIRDLGPTEKDLITGQAILIDRIVEKLGIPRCIEEHVRERGVRILSPLQLAARIDREKAGAAEGEEPGDPGPGKGEAGREPAQEA